MSYLEGPRRILKRIEIFFCVLFGTLLNRAKTILLAKVPDPSSFFGILMSPYLVTSLTGASETRIPTGLSISSPALRGDSTGLSICIQTDLNFIAEEALTLEFQRHLTVEHTVLGYRFQTIGTQRIIIFGTILVFEVISRLTPLGHPRVSGILGQAAITALGL